VLTVLDESDQHEFCQQPVTCEHAHWLQLPRGTAWRYQVGLLCERLYQQGGASTSPRLPSFSPHQGYLVRVSSIIKPKIQGLLLHQYCVSPILRTRPRTNITDIMVSPHFIATDDIMVCRVLLNVMYTMVETLRWPNDNDSDEWKKLREIFRTDLSMWSNYCVYIHTVCTSVVTILLF